MNQPVDVIGIGAINYDYMFHCKINPTSFKNLDRATDSSSENLNWSLEKTQGDITELFGNNFTDCSTQIGGSAFLALRAIKIVCPCLNVGYLGVCGEYNDFDKERKNLLKDIENELSFVDNQEWLFRTTDMPEGPEKYIGKASCTIYKGDREGIGIFPGANNLLKSFIEKKNKTESLVDYLAQARWIHISSLSDFNTWTYIMEFVLQAKEKNRFLKISIDPGNEYTKDHKEEMQKYLREADFIFLSPKEKDNLFGRRMNDDYQNNTEMSKYLDKKPIVIVFKYKNRHVLYDCSKGIVYTHSHKALSEIRIINDTGAGDYFAGGFIGALLSGRLIAHQPAPIEIGNIMSKSRMTVDDIHDASDKAKYKLDKYYTKEYRNGVLNRRQKAMLYFDGIEKIALGFLLSLFTGIISTLIVELIMGIISF